VSFNRALAWSLLPHIHYRTVEILGLRLQVDAVSIVGNRVRISVLEVGGRGFCINEGFGSTFLIAA
jgi:hypothetical protein